MKYNDTNKYLTYVINYLNENDSQHFVHIPNLLTQLIRLGWKVNVISERGGVGVGNVCGHEVNYLSSTGRWSRLPRLIKSLLFLRPWRRRIIFIRISKSAAIISAVLGRVLGWKTLYWVSGAVEDFNLLNGGYKAKFDFFVTWLLFRMVNFLVTGPESMVEYYKRTYSLPRNKIIMLYNDFDLDRILKLNLDCKEDVDHVLMVHRLSPVRETSRYFPELINHLNQYAQNGKSVFLHIVGDGPERAELEELAVGIVDSLNIRFYGAVPNQSLDEYYRLANVFIMPSYREGFPRVILEAMAYGLPIVSTDAGGTRDLVGPLQKEFIINRDNPKSFASSLIDLLNSPAKRTSLSAENLLCVNRFSTQEVARMYDRVFTSLLKN